MTFSRARVCFIPALLVLAGMLWDSNLAHLLGSETLLLKNAATKSGPRDGHYRYRLSEWHLYQNSSANVCGREGPTTSLPRLDCSNVEWPEQPAGKEPRRRQSACPWPEEFKRLADDSGFINFTVANARKLLRGRTIQINGDSTSRRLMWALCNFLANNESKVHASNGDGCCTARYTRFNCNIPEVLQRDIIVQYNPSLRYRDLVDWIDDGGIVDAHGLRNQTKIEGFPSTAIEAEHMPASRTPRSVHVFNPIGATWHVMRNTSCNGMLPGRLLEAGQTCGLDEFTNVTGIRSFLQRGVVPNNSNSTACALVSSFCRRFMDVAPRQLLSTSSGPTAAPVHLHGITNILASPGNMHFDSSNDWMLTIARATMASSRSDDMCSSLGIDNDFTSRRFRGRVSCGYLDQTTWMRKSSNSSERMDCMPSDGWTGVHVYNEYGMLMRMQLLLNAILRAEEEWAEAAGKF